MQIPPSSFTVNTGRCTIRSASVSDAATLATLRIAIDGETEFLDRAPGEGVITPEQFARLIEDDSQAPNHLFLVALVDGQMIGFLRCEGSPLRRLRHKVELGICLLQASCGLGIGRRLLQRAIEWADQAQIVKMSLSVLATNERAIALYQQLGFVREGVLRADKRLADGCYYDTIVMGRCGVMGRDSHD